MNEITFVLRGRPLSRNNSHSIGVVGGRARMFKKSKTKDFESDIEMQLLSCLRDASNFKKNFSEEHHAIKVFWTFETPNLFTKDGKISRNSVDLDAHKVIQDVIFKFLGIDDCFVVCDCREKICGESFKTTIKIEKINSGFGKI